jgi:hypothetical protein
LWSLSSAFSKCYSLRSALRSTPFTDFEVAASAMDSDPALRDRESLRKKKLKRPSIPRVSSQNIFHPGDDQAPLRRLPRQTGFGR